MKQTIYLLISFFYFTIASSVVASDPLIHHSLTITLDPSKSNASIHDIVTIPQSIIQSAPNFRLNKNSKIKYISFNGEDISTAIACDIFLKFKLPRYRHIGKNTANSFKLICSYTLPLEITNNNMETLFISGKDYFYPQPEIKDKTRFKVTFQVKIQAPSNIKVISQGEKLKDSVKNGNGYLIFEGDQPNNVAKGTWPPDTIGLYHTFTKGTYPLPSKEPLVRKKI